MRPGEMAASTAPPALAAAAAPSARRALLINGIKFSVAMSGLEGCVVATIALSAAVVPPALAHTANAMLYLFFAIGTFAAPPLVAALGAKRTMMVCMAAYSLYLAAYIAPDPRVLYPAASLGGFAGALLWTAQGAYFTRNAVEYAACDPADSDSQAISLFAGIFATAFQTCLLLAKPLAGALLTAWPDATQLPFAVYTALAVAFTLLMAAVRPLHPPAGTAEGGGGARCADLVGGGSLLAMLIEPRMLLLAANNAAFGLATALFPSHVTPLIKHSLGAAAAGWLYSVAGVSSALLAAAFAALPRYALPGFGREICIGAGQAAFACACALIAAWCDDAPATMLDAAAALPPPPPPPLPDESCLTWAALLACFVLYGAGIASWQGSCMALVGELWRARPYAAFAHLKFTSGVASFAGFLLLPRLPLRTAALVTLGVQVLGAVGFALFLRVRRRGTSLLADASRERASSTAGGAKPRAEPPCSDTRVEMT